jgi:hypothetical protein
VLLTVILSRLKAGAQGGWPFLRGCARRRDGGQLVMGGTRGRACPAARRGRYRTKAERRTGNGESPAGASRPLTRARRPSPARRSTLRRGGSHADRYPARSARP